MADAQLSVELSARVDAFVNGLLAASNQSNRTDASVATMTSNISRNVANINRLNISQFTAALQAGNISLSQSTAGMANFGKSISQLEGQLSILQNGLRNATDPQVIRRLNQEINRVQASISQINRFASTGILTPLTRGANQAGMALTNLGRVAQDAPFGFIGIQNNLNPLLESFQRLRAETGSNSAAFRALASSLIGAGGLGLALSLVTLAGTLYTQYQQRANKVTKDAKKDTDDYIDSLNQLTQVQLRGAQNALKEQTELKSLYDITQNVAISNKQRLEAIDDLQQKYPAYFKNVKDEAFLAGGASDAYDRLTTSLLATARARAAEDLITKNSSRKLVNEQKIADLQIQQAKNQVELNKIRKQDASFNAETGTGGAAPFAEALQNKAIRDTQKEINNLKTDNNKITAINLKLGEEAINQVKNGADLAGKVGDVPKQGKVIRTLTDVLKDLNIELVQADNTLGTTFGDVRKDKVTAYQKAIDDLIKLGFKPAGAEIEKLKAAQQGLFNGVLTEVPKATGVTGTTAPTLAQIKLPPLATITTGLTDIEKALRKFNENANDIINNGIVATFEGLGSSIGSALADGTNIFASVAQGLLGTLGGILTQLGKVAIETGIGIAAIKTALKTLNPAVAIGAGVALIALGTAISGKVSNLGSSDQYQGVKQIPGFASGVNNFGGGLAIVGEQGRELVNLPTGSSVIPNGRTERLMRGDNSMINISSELAISGGQLYALIRAEQKARGRSGIS